MDLLEFKTKSVLVVDDFANVRKSIKTMLTSLGFNTVHEAHNATTASRIAKESTCDLILCDFNLGVGRDGARLLEEWRKQGTIPLNTIFVLITAETSREMVVSAMEYEPDDYLAKPFTMEVLQNRLNRWFERRKILLPLLGFVEEKNWPLVTQRSKEIMEGHPRYRAEAQKYFVESLIQSEHLTEAENFLHGILSKRFQGWAQSALHKIEVKQNKLLEAEAGFKLLITKEPNQIDAYDHLAGILEIQGKEEERQSVLDQAVFRAPHNINRQKILIESAKRNHDFKRVSTAYRDIISLSAGTMHESLTDFQHYILNLQNDLRENEDDSRKRELQKELASVNRRMNERYPSNVNAHLFSKALTIHNSDSPTSEKHTRALNDLYNQLLAAESEITSETALFAVEVFFKSQRFADGDELVHRFRLKFKHADAICKSLEDLQAEPISAKAKSEATELNLKGIELYKQQQYADSIEYFVKALELSPRHPGIILNFVQSQLMNNIESGLDQKMTEVCKTYLQRLSYLPESHYQYERFQKIRQKLKNSK